ncbi:4Fe-4S dicluster domain-containing protein [Methanobrevibacter sp. DSM 116169]
MNHDKCKGASCEECVNTCAMGIFVIDGDTISIENEEICSLCDICKDVCPNEAIIIEK